jgi:site-specific recombinase XerD
MYRTDESGVSPIVQNMDDRGQMNLQSAVSRYLSARHVELSPDTRKGYRLVLSSFTRVVGPQFPVHKLAPRHIEKWMATQTCSPNSLAGYLSKIRHFTRWLVNQRLLKHDPCSVIRGPQRPRSLPRELDALDVTKILKSCPDSRAELIVSLMVMEGLRCIEVATREMKDVDFGERLLFVKGKGGHERYVPVSDDTMAALRAYLTDYPAGAGPMIRSYSDPTKPISRKYISIMVKGIMADAGVKEFRYDGKSAHALRHTMAGAMLDEGADIRDVQEALGHASLSATVIYTKRRAATGRLREVMGRRSYR